MITGANSVRRSTRLIYDSLMLSAFARSRTVLYQPDSSMSRQRWARTTALTRVLSMRAALRIPRRGIRRCHNLLAAALVTQRNGNVDRNGPAVAAERRAAGFPTIRFS